MSPNRFTEPSLARDNIELANFVADPEHQDGVVKHRTEAENPLVAFTSYTLEEENRVIRKFDLRVVLFVAFLYLLSFLDRSNIGNARIAGLSEDLRLSSSQYEWLLRAFYIAYLCFEWMILLYRIVPAHIYISLCVASWGIFASLQALSTSFWFLLLLRFGLGFGESAFSPGVPFYLSFFYKRDELAYRTALFISAAPLATSFASGLAWVISKLGVHVLHLAPWRALFLVEGFPAVLTAVFAWYHLADRPETAKYLSPRERNIAISRLKDEKGLRDSTQGYERRLEWREIVRTLVDPISYITAVMFFSCNVAFSSLPVFLPKIIEDMGHSAVTSQALTAPPYLISFLIVLVTAHLSDRWHSRGLFISFQALLASLGYAMIALAGAMGARPGWRYAGVYPASFGFFSAVTLIITWTINNRESESGQGTGLAMLNFIGQLGPFLGTHLYPREDGPYYVKGMSICACFMLLVSCLALVLRQILSVKNAHMTIEKAIAEGEDQGLVADGENKVPKYFAYIL